MKKYITILIAFVAMLFAVDAAAYTPPPAPAKGWYVVDQTGRMTPDQINKLNQKIDRISKATKNEFGILFLQDMGGENIEDVANATYKAWGIGKRGLDNGALIVVALKERKSRIETGKGSEGEIPDLRAADILKNNLNPHLKQGDFYGGFDATIDATSAFLESRRNQKADPPPAPVAVQPATTATTHATPANSGSCSIGSAVGGAFGWFFILGTLGVIGILMARSYLRRKAEAEAAERRAIEEARRRRDERRAKIEREARLEAARKLEAKTPVVPAPYVDRQVSIPPPPAPKVPSVRPTVPRPTPRPVIHSSHVKPTVKATTVSPTAVATTAVVAGGGIATAAAAAALAESEERANRERAARRQREEREAEERRAEERRARAEREEEERRARERAEEESRQSSYSSYSSYSSDSSSSYDSGSSSSYDSGGSSDSGGGFGGGDSGGGGASSDW